MSKIIRAREGKKDWADIAGAREYIRRNLGRYDGGTFLTEMSPIPSPKAKDHQLMKWFQSRDRRLGGKIARRKERLKQLLKEHEPSLVVCYGRSLADAFAELLNIEWHPVRPGVYRSPNSKRLLFGFLGSGGIGHEAVQELVNGGILGKVTEPTT